MPQISDWLADLGLEKYLPAFEAAEVDFETLPELCEDDLKELNLPLGPRRKIMAALRRLQDGPALPAPKDVNAMAHSAQAERRHLTIMFIDLVGSTQMSMRLDAEDMREVISKYQNTVSKVVGGFDGFVATLMGDGVLCYFGWPNADEDDTERAVRAGLAAIDATTAITTPDGSALSARVGIATGVVVVGDLIGMGTRQEAVVVGETPNLAARLQSVARPNQVVIAEESRALLSHAFDVVSLGMHELKGVGRPVEAFLVERETAVESRFDARRGAALLPLVGRTQELAQIDTMWSDAKSGKGAMSLVQGEAGIGKSRLVRAAIDGVAADPHIRLTYQCSPYHTDSAFYPFIQQMNLAAGLTRKDSNEMRLNKVETVVQGTPQANALMASLLGLDGTDRYGPQDTSPTMQRVQMMQTIVDFLVRKAAERPLLVVVEDLHWIDPTSLEVLDMLVDRLGDHRILLLATTRPSFEHEFRTGAQLKHIRLDRLGRGLTYAIVDRLAGGRKLPKPVLEIIANQTDGVPLFVEELTRTILESGALKEVGDGFELEGPISEVAIPTTLHDSLMARLDRLGPIKEIAQIASCVGREFEHTLLPQICDIPTEKLDSALVALVKAGMLDRRGTPPAARYQFKHALVRDAAYDSLLKERLRPVHRRILSVFEDVPGIAPELLALHAEAADLTDRAIGLWEDAGIAATARPAYQEAEVHLRRAIKLNAARVAAGDLDATHRALALYVKLSLALAPAKGLWSDAAVTALEEALALADKVGETPLRGDILYGLLLGTYFRGSLEVSVGRADELKGLALASGDTAQLLVARRLAAIGRLNMGRFAQAQGYLDAAEQLCEELEDVDLAARFGHDPIVALKVYQSLNAAFQGRTTRAVAEIDTAMARAKRIGHINTTCTTMGLAGICAQVTGDIASETRYMRGADALSKEHNVAASRMWAEAGCCLLRLAEGDATGLDAYLKAEDTILEANIRLLIAGHRTVAARRMQTMGRSDKALMMADSAEALMEQTGEISWKPEICRLRAEFALADGNAALAEELLLAAVKMSHENGGYLWEIRAATDLAEFFLTQGRSAEVHPLLSRPLAYIAPGDCLAEVEMAHQLLGKLDLMQANSA